MELQYPPDLTDMKRNPSWIQFNFAERQTPRGSHLTDKVSLYMPEAISQPSTVSWDTEKFGFIGNALVGGAKNARMTDLSGLASIDAIKASGKFASGAWGEMEGMGDLMTAYALANAGSAAAQLMGGSVSAEGLMGAVAGKIPNPYLTMVFRGIDFRNFSFVFKFYPFSEEDCETIYKIINTFRANSLPEYEGGEEGKTFLGYPAECEISYQWMDKENPWMHKFKRSVCTAVDVDYTTTGMFSVMRNGFPSCITMATKWSEIELVTRKDIARTTADIGTDKGY